MTNATAEPELSFNYLQRFDIDRTLDGPISTEHEGQSISDISELMTALFLESERLEGDHYPASRLPLSFEMDLADVTNLVWGGNFNPWSRVIQKLAGKVQGSTHADLVPFYEELTAKYLEDKPHLNPTGPNPDESAIRRLNEDIGSIHDDMAGLHFVSDEFAFSDNACIALTELVEERISQRQLSELSNVAFEMWSEYGKLGNPLVSSFLDAGTRDGTIGIPHINLANDYFGKEIFNRTVDKIIGGKPIHVLDLGAGTGGTTEAVVHWVYALASAEGIQDKVNLYVVGVEFNNRLAGEYEVRADALRRQFPGVKISVVEGEMSAYVAELVESSGGTFDAIVASYSLHHLKQQTRTDLFRHSSTLLSNGGVFLRADPSEAKSEINKRYFNFTYEVMTKAGMTYVNSPEAVSKSFRDIEISVREYSNANLYTLKWKSEEPVEKFSVSYRGCTNSESYVAKKCSKVATCLYTDECEDDEICSDSACQKVFCHECQYIENHRCYDYGCCTSNDCRNTQFCSKNECVDLLCSEGYKAKDHLCVETPEEVIVINVTEAEIGEEPSIVCERFQRLKNGKCVNWFWHLIENVQKFLHLA